MEDVVTAREYSRTIHSDEREAENLERRLQRYAKALPADQKRKVGASYALSPSRWAELAALERKPGRPKHAPG